MTRVHLRGCSAAPVLLLIFFSSSLLFVYLFIFFYQLPFCFLSKLLLCSCSANLTFFFSFGKTAHQAVRCMSQ